MSLKFTQSQIQKTILSPVMRQSIEVLMLHLADLNMAIDQELQENPLLEIDEKKTELERSRMEELINQNLKRLSDPSSASSSTTSSSLNYNTGEDDEQMDEKPITRVQTLEEHLLEQLQLELNDSEELKIGELIIGNLNADGYLSCSCEEIAQILGWESVEPVEYILKIIQNLDPIGIGARSLEECLLVQVSVKFNGDNYLLKKMIKNHLKQLGNKKYVDIARALKVPVAKIKKAAQHIGTLEPRPARKYGQVSSNLYMRPDVTVTKDEDGKYQILVNKDNIPSLRISHIYQNMLKQPNRTEEEVVFIREKIKNALIFMKSIEQRHQTVKRIAQYILNYQEDFFKQGESGLKPMKLEDVATSVERNKSTVSRAIHNKYMDTPRGLLPMKFFFTQAISRKEEGSVSNQSIKEEIKELIKDEDKNKPLSDQALHLYFKEKGMDISRRTVSKYRQTLKILPSHLRKNS